MATRSWPPRMRGDPAAAVAASVATPRDKATSATSTRIHPPLSSTYILRISCDNQVGIPCSGGRYQSWDGDDTSKTSPCQFTMLPKALQVYREITYNKGPPLKGHPIKSASVNIRGAYIQYEASIKLITLGNFLGAHGMNQHKSPINRIANLTTRWVCPGPGIENLKVQNNFIERPPAMYQCEAWSSLQKKH